MFTTMSKFYYGFYYGVSSIIKILGILTPLYPFSIFCGQIANCPNPSHNELILIESS